MNNSIFTYFERSKCQFWYNLAFECLHIWLFHWDCLELGNFTCLGQIMSSELQSLLYFKSFDSDFWHFTQRIFSQRKTNSKLCKSKMEGCYCRSKPICCYHLEGVHQQQQVLTNFFQFPDMFASSSHVGQILCWESLY